MARCSPNSPPQIDIVARAITMQNSVVKPKLFKSCAEISKRSII
ncbi:Uncharacterised protein [Vibrio cholerae]|nr:Uncharacterised protein [Vibrio cholerae]